MIYNDIKNFYKQFEYKPVVENAKKLERYRRYKRFVVCGMGGSHLAADLVKVWRPDFPLLVWSNYGLPPLPKKELKEHLLVASSHSGNTEEAIDFLYHAKKAGLPSAAIASGGKLVKMAVKQKIPYVKLPETGVQPRAALGQSLRGLLALMGDKGALKETGALAKILKPQRYERPGQGLARALKGEVPVIYSSERNYAIAYNWKIKFNETGKIPAFCNALPELNHNEMTGFDATDTTAPLSKNFHFIFLKDGSDHPRIAKRMNVLEGLYRDRGFKIEALMLSGKNAWEKIFSSLILADWAAYYAARQYGVEPEQVPMVEEFKRLIR